MRLTITFWRRFTQVVCFALLVYSGFIFVRSGRAAGNDSRAETDGSNPRVSSILFTGRRAPVIDAYPPGAVCYFVNDRGLVKGCNIFLISDALTRRTPLSLVMPAALVFIILSFLVGRLWCGWVCPLGALGDLIDAIRRRLRIRHAKISDGARQGLRIASYTTFFATSGLSFFIGLRQFSYLQKYLYLPFCEICPARLMCPVVAGSSPGFAGGFATTAHCIFTVLLYGLLAFFAAGFMAARRVWCHFCPIGLATSWFNRGGMLELRKEGTRCNRCGVCVDVCPMGCTHIRDEKESELLSRHECIYCLRCVEFCPKKKCLRLNFFGLKLVESWLRPVKAH